jgi:DNA-binding transcriptional MerR regulator
MTIDELAAANGTTTRRVRSLQTLGLLPHPALRGRTGIYGQAHQDRLAAVMRLQEEGFSLESIRVLFRAFDAGASVADVIGLADPVARPAGSRRATADSGADVAELYGFAELQRTVGERAARHATVRPLLSVVPTTVWDESQAS